MTHAPRVTGPMAVAVVSVVLACVSATALRAQNDRALGRILSDDPLTREVARRVLSWGPLADEERSVLERLLTKGVAPNRAAAADVLARQGGSLELRRARFAEEPEAAVRAILAPCLTTAALRVVVVEDESLEVALVALAELVERDELDDATLLRAALSPVATELAGIAAALAVDYAAPLPTKLLVESSRLELQRGAILRALSRRPRTAAVPWLTQLLQSERLDLAERVEVLAAFPRGAIPARHAHEILLAAITGGVAYSRLAAAAEGLTTEAADRLVPEVHRLALEAGVDLTLVLDVLRGVSVEGERRLVFLSRIADAVHREAIVRWLAERESPVILEVVGQALDAPDSIEPSLLRRAGPLLTDPKRRAAAERWLTQAEDVDRRMAAFVAFVDAGLYVPALGAFALNLEQPDGVEARVLTRRVRMLLRLPGERIPTEIWRTILAHDVHEVIGRGLEALRRAPDLVAKYEPELRALAAGHPAASYAALRVLLGDGREEVVRQVWSELDTSAREDLVTVFADRDDAWLLQMLIDDEMSATPSFGYTRARLGDRAVVRKLIRDPAVWPYSWLRRADDMIAAALSPKDLELLESHLLRDAGVSAAVRKEILGWLEKRPDLASTALLESVYENDADPSVRDRAFGELLGRPASAVPLRVDLAAQIESLAALDDAGYERCYSVVGAMRAPLAAVDAAMLARILLRAPLADPREEIATNFEVEEGAPAPGNILANMASQVIRETISPQSAAAFDQEVEELRRLPQSYALGRARLGRLLTDAARTESARRTIAPGLARLVVEAPDLDGTWLGPAWIVLAEAAEDLGAYKDAAAAWRKANAALLVAQPPPYVLRAFRGDDDPVAGFVPTAVLAARPLICDARVSIDGQDQESARNSLQRALVLAQGDTATESEVRALLEELTR